MVDANSLVRLRDLVSSCCSMYSHIIADFLYVVKSTLLAVEVVPLPKPGGRSLHAPHHVGLTIAPTKHTSPSNIRCLRCNRGLAMDSTSFLLQTGIKEPRYIKPWILFLEILGK